MAYTASFSVKPHTLRLEVSVGTPVGNYTPVSWALYIDRYANWKPYGNDGSWSVTIGSDSGGTSTSYSGSFSYNFNNYTNLYLAGGTSYVYANASGYPLNTYVAASGYIGSAGGSASFATYMSIARITQVPGVPTSPTVDQITPTSFRFTFTDGADDGGSAVTSRDIQYSTASDFSASPVTLSGVTLPYTVSGLPNHTTYYVRGRTNNIKGASNWTSGVTAATTGHPTVPLNVVATASTSVTGRVNIAWDAPATTGAGGIVGYNIFRDGVQIATTTGTGTGYSDTGRTPFTSYSYTVAARNAYSTSVSGVGPQSSASVVTAQGPPTAPSSLVAVADAGVPGKIDLSWSAPATAGTGGITGYNVRFSTTALIAATTGTGTTYSVTGLNPGQTYTFVVHARNALADTEGSQSVGSNTATEQALGEPPAPTALSAVADPAVQNRITLTWTPPAGTQTGYSVFERIGSTDTLIAKPVGTTYKIDGLTAGVARTYVVRARNSYTDTLPDGYPGNYGGAESNASTATPSNDYVRTVPTYAGVLNTTNANFNGTFVINQITATTVRYAKTAPNVPTVAVSAGTITNNTNLIFNGTYSVLTPTATTFTYAKTNANITPLAASGTITDDTNATFNGTKTVTAVNVGAKTISYARTGTAVSSRAVPVNAAPGAFGTVSNTTNAVYNGTSIPIVSIPTPYTFTYAKTNANIAESNAAGTVTDVTNVNDYNGVRMVTGVPTYNALTFDTSGDDQADVALTDPPAGGVLRNESRAGLDIKYRSGWAG